MSEREKLHKEQCPFWHSFWIIKTDLHKTQLKTNSSRCKPSVIFQQNIVNWSFEPIRNNFGTDMYYYELLFRFDQPLPDRYKTENNNWRANIFSAPRNFKLHWSYNSFSTRNWIVRISYAKYTVTISKYTPSYLLFDPLLYYFEQQLVSFTYKLYRTRRTFFAEKRVA